MAIGRRQINWIKRNHEMAGTITRPALYKIVCSKCNLPPHIVIKVLDAFYEAVTEQLTLRKAVYIATFGLWSLTERQGRYHKPCAKFPNGHQESDSTNVKFSMSRRLNISVNAWRKKKSAVATTNRPINQAPEGYSTSIENWHPLTQPQSASHASSTSQRMAGSNDSLAPCQSPGSQSCTVESPDCKSDSENTVASVDAIESEIHALFPEPTS